MSTVMSSASRGSYRSVNPTTSEVVATYEVASDADIEGVLSRADMAFAEWRRLGVSRRADVLTRIAGAFEESAEELTSLVVEEMGKRISEARSELQTTIGIWRYYAEHAESMLAPESITGVEGVATVHKEPIGALLGIMPWNYPLYQVARFAAPNLVLGNTIVLKHSPSCPRTALAIERILRESGLPPDAYVNVFASEDQVGRIIADARVCGVSLTGSERAGSAVAAQAGRHVKKVVLELGGSDAMIILDTDDVAATARMVARARMSNTGQACNSPKRIIVLDRWYDELVRHLVDALGRLVPGDPADPSTTLAPLSSQIAAQEVVDQVARACRDGATLRLGGNPIAGAGFYVAPTVLTDVTPGMAIYREEVFGPVAIVFRVADADEAIRLANDNPYGLGASVYCDDIDRARAVAARLDVGMVFINQPEDSEAGLPFGGVKRSGVGRELGRWGIEEFMNHKLVRE